MYGVFKVCSLVVTLSNRYQNNYWPLSKTHNVCLWNSVYQMHIWYTDIGKYILQSAYLLSDSKLQA